MEHLSFSYVHNKDLGRNILDSFSPLDYSDFRRDNFDQEITCRQEQPAAKESTRAERRTVFAFRTVAFILQLAGLGNFLLKHDYIAPAQGSKGNNWGRGRRGGYSRSSRLPQRRGGVWVGMIPDQESAGREKEDAY